MDKIAFLNGSEVVNDKALSRNHFHENSFCSLNATFDPKTIPICLSKVLIMFGSAKYVIISKSLDYNSDL